MSARILVALFAVSSFLIPNLSHAVPERQSFFGGALGFEALSHNGSGTGFYSTLHGGYAFTSSFGTGVHLGYSHIAGVEVGALDFGGFLQLTEPDSGIFTRLYLDGVNATTDSGALHYGVNGSQLGFAPGVGAGLIIPPLGDLHMYAEIAYRLAFLHSNVNLISGTFGLFWDY